MSRSWPFLWRELCSETILSASDKEGEMQGDRDKERKKRNVMKGEAVDVRKTRGREGARGRIGSQAVFEHVQIF
ncbi:hypothetical protein CesoFtcFv8_009354 [Champsocephalus esox]|uniref:Uncharacterized protein n=1 Tax=Champsocephalus esox TaxID=159716 RepID=A0AAN8H1L2_9TELE|nr:hypothetical protein CesoFtcFv8_009354 [Champsocephalus esox]